MLDVQYTADPLDLDKPAMDAHAERPDKPLRLRVQPTLLRKSGDHVAWKGVAWSVNCPTVADAIAVRHALELFFARLADTGVAAVEAALTPVQVPE